MDRYIFRYRFLCVFCHAFDALSKGIKVFHVCWLWFWGNFCTRFGRVFPHFQSLMRLLPCYTADLWCMDPKWAREIKIVTSSNMGTLSKNRSLISQPKFDKCSRLALKTNQQKCSGHNFKNINLENPFHWEKALIRFVRKNLPERLSNYAICLLACKQLLHWIHNQQEQTMR